MPRFNFYNTLAFSILIACFSGCKENKEELQQVYNNYRFDNAVIQKLPLYDSLVIAIQRNQHILIQYSAQEGGTNGFRYMPLSTDAEVYKKLPPEVDGSIGAAYKLLSEKYIAGFDLFPDSSIRVYIRRTDMPKSTINIDEYLSFFPSGKNIRRRVFPEKDTILKPNWQYWARINDEGIF